MKYPTCQEVEFFKAHAYNLKRTGEIHTHCPTCGVKYSKETGFYYGAMYISYGLGVAIFVALWVIFNLFFEDLAVEWQLGIISTLFVLLGPYLYALSKIIWANLFINYDPDGKS
jgi:hypothetical protein